MALFKVWLAIELQGGRTLTSVLADLNLECGTAYQSNWPSLMASRNYSLERLPTQVRRYMLRKVLPVELQALGAPQEPAAIETLVFRLT